MRASSMPAVLFFCACALSAVPVPKSDAAELEAGVARVVLTPGEPVPLAGYGDRLGRLSEGVHDDVASTALVVRQDETMFALVSADLCGISAPLGDAVLQRLADRACPIPPDHILLLPGQREIRLHRVGVDGDAVYHRYRLAGH